MTKFSKEEKAMWVEDWKQSGLSICAYTKENGLNQQTFRNWTKETGSGGFVEVTGKQNQPEETKKEKAGQAPLEILLEKGDIKIHVPFTSDGSSLKTLLSYMAGQL